MDAELFINESKFNLIESKETKEIVFNHLGKNFVAILNNANYNIFKDYYNGTLKNVSLDFKNENLDKPQLFKIQVQIDIPYAKKKIYNIYLRGDEYEDENITIGDYKFTFVKTNKKIMIKCKYDNEKYSLVISEQKYDMFQDYKNGTLPKNIIISSCFDTIQSRVRIIINISNYDYVNDYFLCLNKQKQSNNRIKNEQTTSDKEKFDMLNNAIKELSEKVAKLENN